jgi:hypothetical protein
MCEDSQQILTAISREVADIVRDFILNYRESITGCWDYEESDGKVRLEWYSSDKFAAIAEFVHQMAEKQFVMAQYIMAP